MSDSFATPWTVAHQTPLSMGYPRKEYWSGLPFPSPGELPDPGIKPTSPAIGSQILYHWTTWKPEISLGNTLPEPIIKWQHKTGSAARLVLSHKQGLTDYAIKYFGKLSLHYGEIHTRVCFNWFSLLLSCLEIWTS